MSTADRPKPPSPVCPPAYVGPCSGCGHPTHRYGDKASGPLCSVCHPPVLARQTKKPTAENRS